MRQLNCGLIVSDFDGTLANSQNGVGEEVTTAIKNYISAGGIFAVCTGRILASILPRIRQLDLHGLVVASQGATIAEIDTGEVIKNSFLKPEEAAEICAYLEGLDCPVQAYGAYLYYSSLPADDRYLNLYESIVGVKANHANIPISELVLREDIKCNKVATLCAPKRQKSLFKKLKRRFAKRFDVTCSANVLIEVSPYGETKGEALKYLAAHYNVPIERTCAVGDNLNDLSMLQAAGYGVAVANASKQLLKKAKLITVSNDDGAVAKVIEEYGYIHG